MDHVAPSGPGLLASLWRFRTVVLLVTLVSGVIGYAAGLQQPETYQASARIFLAEPNIRLGEQQLTAAIPAEEYVPRQAARLESMQVIRAAADATGTSPGGLAERSDVSFSVDQLFLDVIVSDGTGEGAAEQANAIVAAYRDQRRSGELDRADNAVANLRDQVEQREAERDVLQEQLQQDQDNSALQSRINALNDSILQQRAVIDQTLLQAQLVDDGVDAVEPATAPDSPSAPQPRLTAVGFAMLGFIGSTVWAYWYAARSERVLSRTDPERVLGVPPLGEIPLYRSSLDDGLGGLLSVDPAAAEAYEFVLSSIEFALSDFEGKSLLVTSTLPGDGKTTTALQLAIAASRDRRRVVLVDADIRARGLTSVLQANDRVGLSDLAALELQMPDVLRRYRFSDRVQLPVITAGQRRGDPASLLRTHAFRRAMASIKESAELLIVDASPLLAVADATIVAGSVDGIVLVVSSGTPVSELQKMKERLKFVSTPLLGYVFNRSDATTAAAYGYGYGVAVDTDGERRLLPRGAVGADS